MNYEDILNKPFEAGNFFEVADIEKYKNDFALSKNFEKPEQSPQHNQSDEYLSSKLVKIVNELQELREYSKREKLFVSSELTEEGMSVMAAIRELRGEKNNISNELEKLKASAEDCAMKGLIYKGTVLCNTFSNMKRLLPEIGSISGRIETVPLFTRNFGELSEKINKRGEKIAVIGGPCLFGTDEMLVLVRHNDGRVFSFDYNTGKYYNRSNGKADMGAHIREYSRYIEDISFENRKTRMTLQEYESIRLPFEFAAALNAPVIIPLPDMSYKKYLDAITERLDGKLRRRVIESFMGELHKISDIYRDVICELADLFKPPKLAVVHDRDKEVLELFYRARAPFYSRFTSGRSIKAISNQPENIESVTDYIFYPALPLYLWGIGNVLQVDSMDEADSLRKCSQAHGTSLSLHGVLYPEKLGKSGTATIFNSMRENKEYI
ncbi:MAG: hypothetical protein LBT23_09025 [Synergistaceae bacterium]|nr:hypothetical protein [Synergistaceae bacterium]